MLERNLSTSEASNAEMTSAPRFDMNADKNLLRADFFFPFDSDVIEEDRLIGIRISHSFTGRENEHSYRMVKVLRY